MRTTVTLRSKDGAHTLELPISEPGEITRLRALGWTEPDPDPHHRGEAAGKYDDLKVEVLKAEIDARNDGRDDDAKLPKTGNKAELIAVLTGDDEDAQ